MKRFSLTILRKSRRFRNQTRRVYPPLPRMKRGPQKNLKTPPPLPFFFWPFSIRTNLGSDPVRAMRSGQSAAATARIPVPKPELLAEPPNQAPVHGHHITKAMVQ